MPEIRRDQEPDTTGRFMYREAMENTATLVVKDAEGNTREIVGPCYVPHVKKGPSKVETVQPTTENEMTTTAAVPQRSQPQILSLDLTEEWQDALIEHLEQHLNRLPFTIAWVQVVDPGNAIQIIHENEQVWMISPQDLALLFQKLSERLMNKVFPMVGPAPGPMTQFAVSVLQQKKNM
jgi:hypothetical protein